MTRTFNGGAVPRPAIQKTVDEIVAAVLAGRFSQWRYENGVGRAQLAGLDAEQVALWRQPTSMQWGPTLRTHEDDVGELAWATKIMGRRTASTSRASVCCRSWPMPTQGDPRDKAWRHHPAGRAHFRMLCSTARAHPSRCSGSRRSTATLRQVDTSSRRVGNNQCCGMPWARRARWA